jgi:hypothetical protein
MFNIKYGNGNRREDFEKLNFFEKIIYTKNNYQAYL